ncbi:MAG: Com family DNA-binding transcriptional regulator [Zoogloeaceae bacterium]|jgi:LSD1 subclass zinc finger protein|nr:Com family DNA-binding transcriptional regulator [Zoogloeaceae bacterium]
MFTIVSSCERGLHMLNKTEKLPDLRCADCGRLLGRGTGTVQIKCRSCKTINHFHAGHEPITRMPASIEEKALANQS